MDLNGNKELESDVHSDVSTEVSVDSIDAIASNVQSLKLFFQNQKQPIIGFKSLTTNQLDSTSPHQPEVQSTPEDQKKPTNRSNRSIPRPPKQIQSCDIKVPPFLKSLVSNQCQSSILSVPSIPPIPMPRKSLMQKTKSSEHNESKRSDNDRSYSFQSHHLLDDHRPNSLIESVCKELNSGSAKLRTYSLHCDSNANQTTDNQMAIAKTDTCSPSSDPIVSSDISLEIGIDKKKSNSSKTKKPFKHFLKRSKLLSLRRNISDHEKSVSKKKQTNSSVSTDPTKPLRPTRSPPAPPILHFRPAAPLPPNEPTEDYYEDTLPGANDNPTAAYELYNDNDNIESEQIYCSLDNEDQYESDSDTYDRIDDYDDQRNDKSYDNFYEDSVDHLDCDSDPIYEVLPFEKDLESDSDSFASNGSTISLDDNQNQIQSMSEVEKNRTQNSEPKLGPFERKQNLKAIKLKKKFNLRGDEIPVSAGVVKEDHRGNRYDLFVRKGETVLILRMEGNPPGKYLAKNERSKVGFVHLDNISFDAESVKCIFKTLASTVSAVKGSTPSVLSTESIPTKHS